jgi:multisubunit Na+/H+ antiporter MnhB subunit
MTVFDYLFDGALATLLPALALWLLVVRDLFKAIVFFVAFGLLLTLVWVRLGAPDVALAEAAIGAGVTGALLFRALRRLSQPPPARVRPTCIENVEPVEKTTRRRSAWRLSTAGLTAAIAIALAWALSSIASVGIGLADAVSRRMPESGVGNPVTAVLLNFRSYDTLLEIGVLLLAVFGATILVRPRGSFEQTQAARGGPVLTGLTRIVVPLAVVFGAYLLWAGADRPGGAFQGGAVIASGWILVGLAGRPLVGLRQDALRRVFVALGFSVFLAVAVGLVGVTGRLLEYPQTWTKVLLLIVESGLTVSIAAILASLFGLLGRPDSGTTPEAAKDGHR